MQQLETRIVSERSPFVVFTKGQVQITLNEYVYAPTTHHTRARAAVLLLCPTSSSPPHVVPSQGEPDLPHQLELAVDVVQRVQHGCRRRRDGGRRGGQGSGRGGAPTGVSVHRVGLGDKGTTRARSAYAYAYTHYDDCCC